MKRILGLDLGPNSIGWAIVLYNSVIADLPLLEGSSENVSLTLEGADSRIIPMSSAILGDFAKGNTVSQTSDRTGYRGTRRLHERFLLRRERFHRVLDLMGFLPEHYSQALTRYGKFKEGKSCILPWNVTEDGKSDFIFMDSYNEMLEDFKLHSSSFLNDDGRVPYDWLIYYLRKKALYSAITKQELAWIILNFNKKRGYYQLRDEEDADKEKGKRVEYQALKVTSVVATDEKRKGQTWYDVNLENGLVYKRTATIAPDWAGKVKDFIITTDVDSSGNPKKDKNGDVKRSVRMPNEDDWTLVMKKTEADINKTKKHVGEYIYDALLKNPAQKIKGGLVRHVERKYYRQELVDILNNQKKYISELNDRELYDLCINELYGSNDAYRESISKKYFTYLFVDDILFYQRPLKSKKSLIAECPYEYHIYTDKAKGEEKKSYVKCVVKSHPLFQEFRLWQFIQNLRIYQNGTDEEVTGKLLSDVEDRVRLFDFLNDRKDINQSVLFNSFFKLKKLKDKTWPYRWNYAEDKSYPCNRTRAIILGGLMKAGVDASFLDADKEMRIWHILYSVADRQELKKAFRKFALEHGLAGSFVDVFSRIPLFDEKDYGSYSAKAIKKLLPLMRIGRYWSASAIDKNTLERIDKIINGECDENIRNRVREKTMNLSSLDDFQGLPLWLACYVVYDRHSEAKEIARWTSPDDIDRWLAKFRQHSLINPVVEQVILETMRTVRDIWKRFGRIDEIHIEMGRDLKNPADKRRQMTERITENENTNLRIKAMLAEFINPEYKIDDVRPYSPSQQDLLRIYEEGALAKAGPEDKDFDFLMKVSKNARPSKSDIMRYKLWLDQKYCSPYTGVPIPLAKLFTPAYEIEHIIPQSRYFDDSFSNKVICESEVNKLKDNKLAYEFIKGHQGQVVSLSMGGTAKILSISDYERNINDCYKRNRAKLKKLLLDDIPDSFIERQMNDSRYISKYIKNLLSNIVREEGEEEAISKNVITCTGSVTDRLKKDWGVNDVWNRIILPRFQRLNELTGTDKFTSISTNGHLIPDMPLELQKGFNKKRIDHRHHAMDAIVIACTTRSHVNLISNEAALSGNNANRYQLSRKLRRYETVSYIKNGETKKRDVPREFLKPWPAFTTDVEKALRSMIVSFKQNIRVINKTINKYQVIEDGKKTFKPQSKGDSWAIRKQMHKDTVFGEVNLRKTKYVALTEAVKNPKTIVDKELKNKILFLIKQGYDVKRVKSYFEENQEVWTDIDLKKIQVYYFSRDVLNPETGQPKERYFATRSGNELLNVFSKIDAVEKAKNVIGKITDTGIQKILLRHLENNDWNVQSAFSAEGIDEMNRNIRQLNKGKDHKPIIKVRLYEKADKFSIGQSGNKSSKFVEAAKGTNLFFAVYETEKLNKKTGLLEKIRTFDTIPLNIVIDRQKRGLPSAPEDENGNPPAFVLSPNDLVYLPTKEELESEMINRPLDLTRVYRMVDSSKSTANFISCNVARVIYSLPKDEARRFCHGDTVQDEFGVGSPKSKNERALTGEMIKAICVPLKIDRLGRITELNGEKYD